jgi:predicted N-acetyltransferase YhbS
MERASLKIRPMESADIDFALALTSREKWSDIRTDFELLIAHSPQAAFVGMEDDKPMGMISAVVYGKTGFIGSLIVLDEYRGKGNGTRLVRFAIDFLERQGVHTMMLDAVPEAVPMYTRLGFKPVCKSLRFTGTVNGSISENVRNITPADIPRVTNLDRIAFGNDRSHFLTTRIRDSPDLCYILLDSSDITGFALGSNRPNTIRIAPWIMAKPHPESGDLIRAISMKSQGKGISLGVLESNQLATKLCRAIGLREATHSIRMARSESSVRPFSEMEYAIGSPAKG